MVTLSSNGHKYGAAIHFDDLQFENGYSAGKSYGQSKLANLLFTYELDRRLATYETTVAVAAHPGAAKTELTRHYPVAIPVVAKPGDQVSLPERADGRPTDTARRYRPRRVAASTTGRQASWVNAGTPW